MSSQDEQRAQRFVAERVPASRVEMGQEIVIVEFQGPLAAKASTPSGGVWLQLLSDEGAELSRDCEVLRVVSISPTEPTDSQAAKIEQRLENDQVRRMRQSGVCPWCGGHV